MNGRFVVRHVLQYALVYAGATVAAVWVVGGPGALVLLALVAVVALLFVLERGSGNAHVHGQDPAGMGSALAAGGDGVDLVQAARFGGAGRLYYAAGVFLLAVGVLLVQL